MKDSDIDEENEMSEEVLDPDNPEHYFLIVERDFNKTLLVAEKIPEALALIAPFNKLFENFFRTYARQQVLEHQTEEMQNVIAEKSHKIDLSMKLAEEDEKTINDLKNQIENAWRLADSAHSREQHAHEVIDNLRKQVEKLNAELDFKNKMNIDDDKDEMVKNRDSQESEKKRLVSEVTYLNTKLENAIGYQEELEKKNSEAELKINELAGLLELERAKQKFSEEQLDLNKTIQDQVEELRQRKADILDLKKDITEKDYKIRIQQNLYKALRSDKNALSKSLQESKYECFELKKKLKLLSIQIEQLKEEKDKLIIKQESMLRSVNKERDQFGSS